MGMTIKEIIDGLQFTIDMFLFNPSTGEIQPKHLLNEDSRLTVDACEGAIDVMRKYQELEQEPTTKNDLGVDCISRKAAEDITWQDPSYTDPLNILTEVRDKIRELPSVTPQEPRKGHWIDTDEWRETVDGFEQWGYFRKCSKCGYVFKFLEIDNYCPNCGADMREVEK